MRLNLAIAAFAIVSLALTSGCAAQFGEDTANDPELNPRSGELSNVTEGARTPIGEKQTHAVATNPENAVASPADAVTQRDYFVKGSLGPMAGVPDIKATMDQDQQLKRSLITAYAGQYDDTPASGAQTSADGH
jgi:hypothetical protein